MAISHLRQVAAQAVHKAEKKGILKRPKKCQRCGASSRVHAHHDDYSKPLDVKYICQPCHIKIHQELRWGSVRDQALKKYGPRKYDFGMLEYLEFAVIKNEPLNKISQMATLFKQTTGKKIKCIGLEKGGVLVIRIK